jgi:predicted MPP superfamily phosphohydrolase
MKFDLRRLVYAALGLALATLAWATLVEPRRLVIHRVELPLPRVPSGLQGLRIALLSDLHVGSPHWGIERLPELVARANAESPDLIVLAGDYISGVRFGTKVPPEAIAVELARLHAPLGVIAVLGNHDVWFDGARVANAFEAHGVRVLENEIAMLTHRGTDFCVLGLADQEMRPHRVREALELVPPGVFALAVVHEPDTLTELDARIALTLAGHTHGGQVNLPFFGRLIVPSNFGARFAAGHVTFEGRHMFVTTGIGTSIMPLRFRVPPEIAVLTLR